MQSNNRTYRVAALCPDCNAIHVGAVKATSLMAAFKNLMAQGHWVAFEIEGAEPEHNSPAVVFEKDGKMQISVFHCGDEMNTNHYDTRREMASFHAACSNEKTLRALIDYRSITFRPEIMSKILA